MTQESSTTTGHDAAGHEIPYVQIWAWLVFALVASFFIGELTVPVLGIAMIFTIATVKAYLVIANFMHVKFEPKFVLLILGAAALSLYFFFFGLVPDTVYGPFK